MSELDSQISRLKAVVESSTAARYRAEAAREAAEQSHNKAMDVLRQRYGLDNLGDARAKLTELETALASKVAEATAILDSQNL